MKQLILIFVLALTLGVSCKKNNKLNSSSSDIYCVYIVNTNGSKTFNQCAKDLGQAQDLCIDLRNSGKEGTYIKKSDCADC